MDTRARDTQGQGTARVATGDGPGRTAPVWLGYAAAVAGLVLGIAHLLVTGGFVVSGQQDPTPGFLVWVFGPLVVMLGLAAAAVALVRPGAGRSPGRWLVWTAGTAAVLTTLLSLFGFASLLFGASPASLFLGPGPYALPGAVLFTALTLNARARRRTTAPPAGRSVPLPGTGRGSGRAPA